jgi:hypothetical protein
MLKYYYLYIPIVIYIIGNITEILTLEINNAIIVNNIITIIWFLSIGYNFYKLHKEYNAKIYFCYSIFLLVSTLAIDSGLFFLLPNFNVAYENYIMIEFIVTLIVYLGSTIFIHYKLNKESCSDGSCPF